MSSGSSVMRSSLAVLLLLASALGLASCRRTQAQHATHIEAPFQMSEVSPAESEELRVCADPNNMPFSNRAEQGFENRIAGLVAHAMDRRLSYYWMPQRRGFVRNTLQAGFCDLIMGVPSGLDRVSTTSPYYTSTYVFLTRHRNGPPLRSLDDPGLRRLTIGVQLIGDDYANPPPVQALAARALIANVRGYTVYGDYSRSDPQRDIVDAVARGEVDAAIVWGPLAGYFARSEPPALRLDPVVPAIDRLSGRFVFSIAMGVRKDDQELRSALEGMLVREHEPIRQILQDYGVPLVNAVNEPESVAMED